MPNSIIIKNLGLCDYQQTLLKMQNFTATRNPLTCDEIWLLEHHQVFTQGIAERSSTNLNYKKIPMVQTDRGGKTTYHGPGQLICYLLFDLHRSKIGIKKFVNIIENSVIELLAKYKISAHTMKNAPGIYVANKKICSIGLKISRGCSYHGYALNVNNDLEPFNHINPCGTPNLPMTKVNNFTAISCDEIKNESCKILIKNLRFHSPISTKHHPTPDNTIYDPKRINSKNHNTNNRHILANCTTQ